MRRFASAESESARSSRPGTPHRLGKRLTLALLALAAFALVLLLPALVPGAEQALADTADPFSTVKSKGASGLNLAVPLIRLLAGGGILTVAVLFFFKKAPWGWLAGIAFGLLLLLIGPEIVSWITEGQSTFGTAIAG